MRCIIDEVCAELASRPPTSISDMEEKSRGFSLRHKKTSRRPPISAPRQIPSNLNPAVPSLGRTNGNGEAPPEPLGQDRSVARPKPRVGGGTSDIVKRRYSTRFTNLPEFSTAGAPSVPALPASSTHLAQPKRLDSPASQQKINIDQGALKNPGLDAEKCKNADPTNFHPLD